VSEQKQSTLNIETCQRDSRALLLDEAKQLWRLGLKQEPQAAEALAAAMDDVYRDGARIVLEFDSPVPGWVPPILAVNTCETWSKHLGRLVRIGEAVEILKPVRRLAGALANEKGGVA
jgi:hypothetical protein